MKIKRKERPARWWDYAVTLCVLLVIGAILWNSQQSNAISFIAQTAPAQTK